MSEGDKNTKFFHAQCNERRRTNHISGLRDSAGVWQTEKTKIAEIAVDYFQGIFTSSNPSAESITTLLQGMESVVTNAMNDQLQAEFTKEEVSLALKQMYPTKAPGPDGMSAIFYQTYWDIVGPEVTQAILSILHSGYMLRKINYTHIALILKVKNPENITDFRPISLCNVIYKIVSKVLANRLKKLLPFVISEAQSAFIPGRLITDNVLVAFEVMHLMSLKRKGRKGQMALKLDMSKAYDRVEWVFLESIMRCMVFAEEWIRLMMMCLRSVSYSVLINGEQCGYFTASRGICQGDSLSPYLFIMCAEGVSFLLRKAAIDKRLNGVAASQGGPKLTHLFFADDSLLFCQVTIANCEAVGTILQQYEYVSGQQLNRAKTSIFFTKNTSMGMRRRIQDYFQVPEIKNHEKYLGLPSFVGRSKSASFGEIKGQVWRRMNGWKEKFLSQAGCEVLIKAVAQSIPTYSKSCFKLPESLCNDLNTMFSNFWWGHHDKAKKAHWVRWSKLCNSKASGGLGFRDLKTFNLALLAKQGWRFLQHQNSLVFRVFKAKYFPQGDFMLANLGNRPSYAWRSIALARKVLRLGLRWNIGDGCSVKISEDPWLPLSSSFKSISAQHVLDPKETVSILINEDSQTWNVDVINPLFSRWEAQIICAIPLPPRKKLDCLFWNDTKSGLFTVKSAYHLQLRCKAIEIMGESSSGGKDLKFWKFLWSLSLPPKVKAFMWHACSGILPTYEMFFNRHMRDNGLCPGCTLVMESTTHTLWTCSVANDVWVESSLKLQKWDRYIPNFCDLMVSV